MTAGGAGRSSINIRKANLKRQFDQREMYSKSQTGTSGPRCGYVEVVGQHCSTPKGSSFRRGSRRARPAGLRVRSRRPPPHFSTLARRSGAARLPSPVSSAGASAGPLRRWGSSPRWTAAAAGTWASSLGVSCAWACSSPW